MNVFIYIWLPILDLCYLNAFMKPNDTLTASHLKAFGGRLSLIGSVLLIELAYSCLFVLLFHQANPLSVSRVDQSVGLHVHYGTDHLFNAAATDRVGGYDPYPFEASELVAGCEP